MPGDVGIMGGGSGKAPDAGVSGAPGIVEVNDGDRDVVKRAGGSSPSPLDVIVGGGTVGGNTGDDRSAGEGGRGRKDVREKVTMKGRRSGPRGEHDADALENPGRRLLCRSGTRVREDSAMRIRLTSRRSKTRETGHLCPVIDWINELTWRSVRIASAAQRVECQTSSFSIL
jgi:hypothetical protein